MSILLMVAGAIAGLFYFQIQNFLKNYQDIKSNLPTPQPADPTQIGEHIQTITGKLASNIPTVYLNFALTTSLTPRKEGVQFWGPDLTVQLGMTCYIKSGLLGYDPGKYSELKNLHQLRQ